MDKFLIFVWKIIEMYKYVNYAYHNFFCVWKNSMNNWTMISMQVLQTTDSSFSTECSNNMTLWLEPDYDILGHLGEWNFPHPSVGATL